MRAIVTRPEIEADRWVRELSQRGLDAIALPLVAISPAHELEPLRNAWRDLESFQAVMFVSGNAVSSFFLARPSGAVVAWPPTTRAWAPGPGTVQALIRAGLDRRLIDSPAADAAQFDSESLWQQAAGQVRAGSRVLIVRGADAGGRGSGREWLAEQLAEAGAGVESLVAYRRGRPEWNSQQLELARQAAADGSVWLFSSSEALANLRALLPDQDWSRARAIATHPRIAESARKTGVGVVCVSRPGLEAVVADLESFR